MLYLLAFLRRQLGRNPQLFVFQGGFKRLANEPRPCVTSFLLGLSSVILWYETRVNAQIHFLQTAQKVRTMTTNSRGCLLLRNPLRSCRWCFQSLLLCRLECTTNESVPIIIINQSINHHHHHFICPIIQQYAHLHEYNKSGTARSDMNTNSCPKTFNKNSHWVHILSHK